MGKSKFTFPDGGTQLALTAFEAFCVYNAKRAANGYGLFSSCFDENGNRYSLQVYSSKSNH